jgi:hypothetical protein
MKYKRHNNTEEMLRIIRACEKYEKTHMTQKEICEKYKIKISVLKYYWGIKIHRQGTIVTKGDNKDLENEDRDDEAEADSETYSSKSTKSMTSNKINKLNKSNKSPTINKPPKKVKFSNNNKLINKKLQEVDNLEDFLDNNSANFEYKKK